MTPGEQTRDFYRKQGAQAAQERIIKLLESNATGEYKQVMLTPKLISEIQGEK